MTRASNTTCGIWKLMPPKTIDFLLNCLFAQDRQSNYKGGSREELLMLKNINDLGGPQCKGFVAAFIVS